jgi:hypothetical protein
MPDLDSEPLVPLTLYVHKFSVIQSLAIYYEWNAKDQKWMKLNDDDPDPPADLEPGRYDGQIHEVPRPQPPA